MAPKSKPYNELRKSARNYRKNPLSRERKNSYNRNRNSLKINKRYRAGLNKARRDAGEYGKGGKDFSHTKGGGLTREDPSTNRARNRGKK